MSEEYDLRRAVVTLRLPQNFQKLMEALEWEDNEDMRGKIDEALNQIAMDDQGESKSNSGK